MTPIVFDDDLVRQILTAEPPIELIDPRGRLVGRVEVFENETVQEVRRRLNILPATDSSNS
jgi:hypothetical protein